MQFVSDAKLNQETEANSKITTLENNINRINNEQDGLMKQMKLFEDVHKIEELIHLLQGRIEEYENCGKLKSKKQNNSYLSHQIKQLESRMIEMDNQILNSKTQPRRPEILQIENTFKKNMNSVKQEVQQEYKNIYKEMNGLRCDLDYVINSQVKQKITNKIKSQNINLDNNKLLFINLLELETFIEELDLYENQNTQRFLEELINCDSEKATTLYYFFYHLHKIYVQISYKFIKIILKIIEFNCKSLNYQLAGTKRKYLSEIKKIEHKFKILAELVLLQQNSQIYKLLYKKYFYDTNLIPIRKIYYLIELLNESNSLEIAQKY